jgi:hypothetical protein
MPFYVQRSLLRFETLVNGQKRGWEHQAVVVGHALAMEVAAVLERQSHSQGPAPYLGRL